METPQRPPKGRVELRSPLTPKAIDQKMCTRAESGRLLHCTPKAARPFCSPVFQKENSQNSADSSLIVSPSRKRTQGEALLTPLQLRTPPLVKRNTASLLSSEFVTATTLLEQPDQLQTARGAKPSTSKTSSEAEAPSTSTSSKSPPMVSVEIPRDADSVLTCLPQDVLDKYMSMRKLAKFYDWQLECLSDVRLLRGTNCILSLPTGAGKTLIAEILMIREAIVNKRSALLVLPYVAIVQEKISALSPLEEVFGVSIEEYAANKGRLPPIKRRKRVSVYVATIEKANMLINSLIVEGKLDEVGLVVIDELHMIGDGERGSTIEQLLSKFLFKGSGQVVGMSATLPNMGQLSTALRAFVYSTDFRPVALIEYVKIGNRMWKVLPGGRLVFDADLPENRLAKIDPDGVCQLIQGLIPSKSAIIFCPNKKNCENVALLIAKSLPQALRDRNAEEKRRLVASIFDDNDGKVDESLRDCLLAGTAYHHSGLTHDERKHVEAAFSEGLVYVICATSTLAAGVNLPVRRVIIKAPMVGRARLGKAQYLQMAGRAGRAGFDTKGDCITIVRPGEEERCFREMLLSAVPECRSSLADEFVMANFVLDVISLGLSRNVDEILEVLRFSLLASQTDFGEMREIVERVVQKLKDDRLLEDDEENGLRSTDLGDAVFTAGLAPAEAGRLHSELVSSLNEGVVFASHFHLLFIVTPYDCVCRVDWDLFHSLYVALPQSEKKLLGNCGLAEQTIMRALVTRNDLAAGTPPMRLYIALMLQRIWNHDPMWAVAERFGVDRGWMQSTLQSSIAQAASISKFSEKIPPMWPLRLLLPELVQRLAEAANPEVLPLLAIDGVKKARAAQLYKSGFRNVAQIAKSTADDLLRALGTIRRAQAVRIINSAKTLLRDQLDEKLEEIDALGIDVKDLEKEASVTSFSIE